MVNMTTASIGKLRLPRLDKVVLKSFSLYSSEPSISIVLPKGVFCLAGANGLGKSTFLLAIHFGLTGIVSDPARRFESVEEYYRHSIPFSESFFCGRIDEKDRDAAEIEITFTLGMHEYYLVRGMFEPLELRSLTVKDTSTKTTSVLLDGSSLSGADRHSRYAEQLTEDIGLSSFDQFAFLQHFVFTFDERRQTLFWDQRLLEAALYLAFGLDPKDATKADSLRRAAEKADSRARNCNYQATETRKKITDLQATFSRVKDSIINIDDLEKQHELLQERTDSEYQALQKILDEIRDANFKIADCAARETALRDEYTTEFNRRMRSRSAIARHPLVRNSLEESECGLCGARGSEIPHAIQEKLKAGTCPLCGYAKQATPANNDISRLKQLDEEIGKMKESISLAQKTAERLRQAKKGAEGKLSRTKKQLDEFEDANGRVLAEISKAQIKPGGIDAVLKSYRSRLEDFLQQKQKEYEKRDEYRKELAVLQKQLEKRYAEVEGQFVPLFSELAHLFLGLDLQIQLATSTAGAGLQIEVRGSARREQHQLSESQRFFLDIALRMALTLFMSDPSSRGGLFIDTPEGSLDIAYEKRAGDMLARFAEKGHQILMTANINSSKLLLSLAGQCSKKTMSLCRMTTWTDLSDVQVSEEKSFDDAYALIEAALRKMK